MQTEPLQMKVKHMKRFGMRQIMSWRWQRLFVGMRRVFRVALKWELHLREPRLRGRLQWRGAQGRQVWAYGAYNRRQLHAADTLGLLSLPHAGCTKPFGN